MNELNLLYTALKACATAPWLPWALLLAAGLRFAWSKRSVAYSALRKAYCVACEKSKGKLPSLNATTILVLVATGLLVWQRFSVPSVPGPDVPPPVVTPVSPVSAVVYVYEKDDTAPASGVYKAIDRLNRERKGIASIFEEDTVDGSGETPDQYKLPLSEARTAGLPALVVVGGDKALKVVKNPTTEAQVMEAVQ